jgi:1,4-alpha-glucan branching enzyme
LHVESFNDPSSNIPGTFNQIIDKLPYLRDLGINAIEIMPIAEFSGPYSWGYNPAQPFSVENLIGGPQGLYKFVKAAHSFGIAIILDVVYNHCGPDALDLWQFDGWTDINHNGGIYFYDNQRAKTAFGDTRFDYGRSEIRQYIRDNALFWLNKYRIDGLRFDSVVNIRNVNGNNNDPTNDLPDGWSLLQWINNEIQQSQPWKITIAEDLQNNRSITKGTNEGGTGFSSQWDGNFVYNIRKEIITPNDYDRDMISVCNSINNPEGLGIEKRVIYTESHDADANGNSRVPEMIWPGNADSYYSQKRSVLGAAMVFTGVGIPMIFQGQEFLEDGYFQDNIPLDWNRLQVFGGINLLYRDLIRLRRNWYNQTKGLMGQNINVFHINNFDKLIAFHRWQNGGPGDDVLVIANFANRTYNNYNIGIPRLGMWKVRFNSDWNGYSKNFNNIAGYDTLAVDSPNDNMPYQANIGIGPYAVLILSQD